MFDKIYNDTASADIIKNEIAIQNLISIASNPVLFNSLDDETRIKLIDVIILYTNGSLKTIDKYDINGRNRK